MKTRFRESTLTAFLALIFFAGMFRLGLSDPPRQHIAAFVGIVFCSILTIILWLIERPIYGTASSAGLWIVGVILTALVLLTLLPLF